MYINEKYNIKIFELLQKLLFAKYKVQTYKIFNDIYMYNIEIE